MRIRVLNDKNNIIDEIFQEEKIGNYYYLDTNLLLCLLYDDNITWKYDRKENKFYISNKETLLDTLNLEQWKNIFKDNKIKIDKETNNIFVRTNENIEKRFLNFLEINNIEFKKRTYILNPLENI